MAEVYVITNKINGKQYVGKTNRNAETRMKEHKEEMHKTRSFHRPLYRALRKYGPDQFSLEVAFTNLSAQEAEEKEIDLIDKLGTFNKGYNATIGGDGKTYRLVSEEEISYIIDLYIKENLAIREIAKELDVDQQTVSNRLKEAGIEIPPAGRTFMHEPIIAIKDGKEREFESVELLAQYLIDLGITKTDKTKSVRSSIKRCLDGQRKTYFGYTFRQ